MTTIRTKIFAIVIVAFAFSCNSAQENEDNAQKSLEQPQEMSGGKFVKTDTSNMQEPLKSYMMLKDALVATDPAMATNAAAVLANSLEGNMKDYALKIVQTNDIAAQRELFFDLSEGMYASMKTENTAEGQEVYKQYCPMAFNNEGAFWLSSDKVIMNPYFGDKMLKCGEIEETLIVTK